MKKKITGVMLAAAMAATLSGCTSELSNDYVTVTQYKGLQVSKPQQTEVTDDEVEQVIESNLSIYGEREEVTDRAAQTGDIVNIDYTGTIDGEAFDGGSEEGAELQLGSNSFIGATEDYQGFEEQIVGHNTGDEFDITVQFPEEYSLNPDMAGVVADFHIVLNSIQTDTVPELTDEWVQQNSEESETVDEYREEIRSMLEETVEETARSEMRTSVLDALLGSTEVKQYPEDAINEQKDRYTAVYTQTAELYGMEMGEFLETYMETTEDEFNTQAQEYAEQTVALQEAVKLVAEKENLEPSEEEYEERMAEYAEQSGYDDVESFAGEVGEDALRAQILQDAVADYLVDECTLVEQSDSAQ